MHNLHQYIGLITAFLLWVYSVQFCYPESWEAGKEKRSGEGDIIIYLSTLP